MHRSRPLVLVILAAAAACSKHDPSEGNDLLSQDRTLVARLEPSKDMRRPTVPDACGVITIAAAPAAADQQRADELTQQANVAEMHGDIQDAQLLLRRAASLDGTNKSAAYHLGRTSEALGDRTTAMNAYCHYLALAPTATESVEARQRVAALARSVPRATGRAARRTSDSMTAPHGVAAGTPTRLAHAAPTAASRVAERSTNGRSTGTRSSTLATESPRVVASGETRSDSPPAASTEVGGTRGSSTAGGDVDASPASPSDPAPTPPRAERRGSIGAQSAIIGVAAGAILGAATGRSVKSTVIGAAAGGVLGTVVGTTARPTRRSVRS